MRKKSPLPDMPGYRLGVGVMLLNSRNQVFVARRINMTDEAWQMPQGGIDAGADPETTAFRELKEEIGSNNADIVAQSEGWLRYELPDEMRARVWKGRYKGQVQKWFAMRFKGEDKDIDLETEHPEFNAWKWVEADQVPVLIVPFKRALYVDVITEFKGLF